jgi:hypothetical protein
MRWVPAAWVKMPADADISDALLRQRNRQLALYFNLHAPPFPMQLLQQIQ